MVAEPARSLSLSKGAQERAEATQTRHSRAAGIQKPRKNTLPRAGSFLRSVVGYCADEEPMESTWIPAFAGMTGRLVCGSAHRALYTRRAGHFDRLPPRGSTPSDRLKSSQLHFHCLRCASVPPPAPPPSVAFFALFSGSRATFSTSSICSAKTNVTFFRTVFGMSSRSRLLRAGRITV